MKTIIKATLFTYCLLISIGLFGQEIKKGDHIKNNKLNDFIGTWKWTAGDSTFMVSFEKVTFEEKASKIKLDLLGGWYMYTIGANTILKNSKDKWKGNIKETQLLGDVDEEGILIVNFNTPHEYTGYILIIKLINRGKEAIMELAYKNNPTKSISDLQVNIPKRITLEYVK